MIKITTKKKDDVQPRNIAIILGKYSVICISRNYWENILHKTKRSFAIKSVMTETRENCSKSTKKVEGKRKHMHTHRLRERERERKRKKENNEIMVEERVQI